MFDPAPPPSSLALVHIFTSASRTSFFFLRSFFDFIPAMFFYSCVITFVSVALALATVDTVLAVPLRESSPLASRKLTSIPNPVFPVYLDRSVDPINVLPPADTLVVRILPNLRSFHIWFTDYRLCFRAITSSTCASTTLMVPVIKQSSTLASPRIRVQQRRPNIPLQGSVLS